MIAGTYTPSRLPQWTEFGRWNAATVYGIGDRHRSPHEDDRQNRWSGFRSSLSLALGWMILVGIRPMPARWTFRTARLIGVAAGTYSIGTTFTLAGAGISTTQFAHSLRGGRGKLSLPQLFSCVVLAR